MANTGRSYYPRYPADGIPRLARWCDLAMTDCSTYAVSVTFHGITYYGTVKSDLGPKEFLNHIAETGDIGEGFKFAFPGEPWYAGGSPV